MLNFHGGPLRVVDDYSWPYFSNEAKSFRQKSHRFLVEHFEGASTYPLWQTYVLSGVEGWFRLGVLCTTKFKSPNQQWLGLFSWGHFLYLITELDLARCGAVVLRQLLRYWFNDHPQATPYTGRPRRRPSNTDCLGAVTARSCVTPHEPSSGPPSTFKSGASKLVKMGWCTGGSIGCCVAVVGVFAGGY